MTGPRRNPRHRAVPRPGDVGTVDIDALIADLESSRTPAQRASNILAIILTFIVMATIIAVVAGIAVAISVYVWRFTLDLIGG